MPESGEISGPRKRVERIGREKVNPDPVRRVATPRSGRSDRRRSAASKRLASGSARGRIPCAGGVGHATPDANPKHHPVPSQLGQITLLPRYPPASITAGRGLRSGYRMP
jgi:hypothetical protein